MERKWVSEVNEKILAKEKKVAQRSRNKIPYTTKDGVFDDRGKTEICWWTNGFWGGMMWQLYHATGEPVYLENALRTEIKLDENLMNRQGMDHDSGFKWLPTAVVHYRVTGDMASRNRALLAADNLASRFNPVGKFIRAWNNWDGNEDGSFAGRAIIDCMMNLPLLYWAGDELHDPRFCHIAKMHADTAIKNFIREDGSAKHIIEFDAETGEYLHSVGGQGYGHGSSWTRGQAWAVYGFMLSYIHTKEERYLATAKKVADYFIANIPDSKLIPVDFRQPQTPAYEDSTGGDRLLRSAGARKVCAGGGEGNVRGRGTRDAQGTRGQALQLGRERGQSGGKMHCRIPRCGSRVLDHLRRLLFYRSDLEADGQRALYLVGGITGWIM